MFPILLKTRVRVMELKKVCTKKGHEEVQLMNTEDEKREYTIFDDLLYGIMYETLVGFYFFPSRVVSNEWRGGKVRKQKGSIGQKRRSEKEKGNCEKI